MRGAPLLLLAFLLSACAGNDVPQLGSGKPGLNVARAALAGGSADLALNVSNTALADDPRNVAALAIKGDALSALGRAEEAAAVYEAALVIAPASTQAQIGLGRLRLRSDAAHAQVLFLAVVQREPQNVVALNDLGIAYDLQGNHAGAQAAYRKALGSDPTRRATEVNLALSMALSGRAAEAVPLLRPLATDAAATKRERHDLAAAFALSGNDKAARQILATDLSPDQVDSAMRAYAAFGR